MSEKQTQITDRAMALRLEFDQSFAEARSPDRPAVEDLLAIRVGSEPYALRLSEIAGLFTDRRVTPLPARAPALLGVAGFRGAVIPVYDLDRLLGRPHAKPERWLAMAADTPVAFAIGGLEGLLRIAPDAIVQQQQDRHSRQHVREFLSTKGVMRPIVHLPSVVNAIRRQAQANPSPEDR